MGLIDCSVTYKYRWQAMVYSGFNFLLHCNKTATIMRP